MSYERGFVCTNCERIFKGVSAVMIGGDPFKLTSDGGDLEDHPYCTVCAVAAIDLLEKTAPENENERFERFLAHMNNTEAPKTIKQALSLGAEIANKEVDFYDFRTALFGYQERVLLSFLSQKFTVSLIKADSEKDAATNLAIRDLWEKTTGKKL